MNGKELSDEGGFLETSSVTDLAGASSMSTLLTKQAGNFSGWLAGCL